MNLFDWDVVAGESRLWSGTGKYFRLLDGVGDVKIRVSYPSGGQLVSDVLIGVGVDLRNPETGEAFNAITFESATTQRLKVLVSNLPTTDSRLSGKIELKPRTNYTGLPMMTASGTIAANADRAQLELVADASNAGVIWLGGVANEGLPLRAGGTYQLAITGSMPVLITGTDKLYIAEVS